VEGGGGGRPVDSTGAVGGTGTDSEEVVEDRCAFGKRRSWSTTGRGQ